MGQFFFDLSSRSTTSKAQVSPKAAWRRRPVLLSMQFAGSPGGRNIWKRSHRPILSEMDRRGSFHRCSSSDSVRKSGPFGLAPVNL